jgi:AraC-like DNA-binding protein
MLDFRHLRHSSRTVARLLPHGEGFAEHCHDRGHLIYAASGVLTIRTRRGTAIVPPNRAAWTPAGVRHQHRAYGRTEMRVLFLPEPPSARLREPVVLATSPLVRELLLAITGDHQYPTPSWERLRDVLLDELTRAPEQDLHLPEPSDTRLRAVTDLLHADPAVPGTLAELGRAVGASERTLSRLCHTELGMSFRAWRTQLRIQHALVLLAQGDSVQKTANACGWSNPSSFIDAFTAVLGDTPGRYRTQAR